MLKKEISETLKQAVFFIAAALLIPGICLIFINQTYLEIFFPCFQFGLFFWALLMGNFIFSLDRGQRGIEYLLSLPFSRLQIIGMKVLPRISALIIFYLAYLVIHNNGGSQVAAMAHISFTGLYFSLFLIAFSFSASSENFVISSLVSVFFLFFYFHLFFLEMLIVSGFINFPFSWSMNRILAETDWLYFTSMGLPVSLILIIPFPIAFILTFRKFDIRPALTFNRKLFKHLVLFLIPALAFSFLVGYLGTREYSQGYYLTLDNKLIENNWIFNSVKIYDQNKVVKINTYFNLWPSFEIDHYVIGGMFESQQFEKKFVVRKLDLKNSEIKSIYETTASKYVGFWKFNKEVLLIEEGENSTTFTLVIIDVISGEARRIEANLPSAGYSFPQIFGTDKLENRRFWLVSSKEEMNRSVWRLWEDGELESLGYSYRLPPFYINRMLFLYTEDGIDACIIDSIGKKMFREISDSVAFSSLNRKDLSNDSLTEIYGRQGQKIVRLDLKNFEISEIGDYEGAIFNNFPGDFYFIKMPRDDRTITELYHLKDGRMKFLQEFFLKKSKTNKPWDQFYIFKTGIVATKKRKVTVFAFPDMKVLKLKGL